MKLKKGKSMSVSSSSSSVAPTSKLGWSFNDPKMQRKKRVAGYKVYAYSASYAYSQQHCYNSPQREMKLKKGKSMSVSSSSSSAAPTSKLGWSFNDPEMQRKKRVAGDKVYATEGKMKGSFRKSFKWLKDRYTQVVYGWWCS